MILPSLASSFLESVPPFGGIFGYLGGEAFPLALPRLAVRQGGTACGLRPFRAPSS